MQISRDIHAALEGHADKLRQLLTRLGRADGAQLDDFPAAVVDLRVFLGSMMEQESVLRNVQARGLAALQKRAQLVLKDEEAFATRNSRYAAAALLRRQFRQVCGCFRSAVY